MTKSAMILLGLLIFSGAVFGASEIELGIKMGQVMSYSQGGLQIGANDISRQTLVGGQLYLPAPPVIDLIASVDYSWHDKNYSFAADNLPFRMRDLAVTLSAVLPVQVSSLSFYIGGGVGSHSISYAYSRPTSLSLSANDIIIPEASTYFGYHGIVGVKGMPPRMLIGFFAEGRLTRIDAVGAQIKYSTVSAGLCLPLP
jgi:hypothetical protein